MLLSRRKFVQITGAALVGARFFSDLSLFESLLPKIDAIYGRTLNVAPVVNRSGHLNAHLWADSVIRLLDATDTQYRVESGYVAREFIQPMHVTPQTTPFPATPFVAEVAAPSAPVLRWCSADAPLVTRIGHGGVGQVIDQLKGEHGNWFALADSGDQILGWTQAAHWRAAGELVSTPQVMALTIDTTRGLLTAYSENERLLEAPFSRGAAIGAGHYALSTRRACATCAEYHGIAWATVIEGIGEIGGAYWHNQFGTPHAGHAIQVTPLVARWLYSTLSDTADITVS